LKTELDEVIILHTETFKIFSADEILIKNVDMSHFIYLFDKNYVVPVAEKV
jgi:hypothetical protein